MEFSQNNIDSFQEMAEKNKKSFYLNSYENFGYLYPNGHRFTPQMRWFKGSVNRGYRADIA